MIARIITAAVRTYRMWSDFVEKPYAISSPQLPQNLELL
jgi:hypothetical protein